MSNKMVDAETLEKLQIKAAKQTRLADETVEALSLIPAYHPKGFPEDIWEQVMLVKDLKRAEEVAIEWRLREAQRRFYKAVDAGKPIYIWSKHARDWLNIRNEMIKQHLEGTLPVSYYSRTYLGRVEGTRVAAGTVVDEILDLVWEPHTRQAVTREQYDILHPIAKVFGEWGRMTQQLKVSMTDDDITLERAKWINDGTLKDLCVKHDVRYQDVVGSVAITFKSRKAA